MTISPCNFTPDSLDQIFYVAAEKLEYDDDKTI